MNIAGTMKKLQKALLETGLVININRTQFYSAEQNRFIPIISLSTKVSHFNKRTSEWKEQSYEIIRTSSQVDALMCLVDIYKAVRG